MKSKLWVVFQLKSEWRKPEDGGTVTEFQGVFDSEKKAILACRDEKYCIAPVCLNKKAPHESTAMKGAYYPKAKYL